MKPDIHTAFSLPPGGPPEAEQVSFQHRGDQEVDVKSTELTPLKLNNYMKFNWSDEMS